MSDQEKKDFFNIDKKYKGKNEELKDVVKKIT